jgi:hypothetical protein
MCNPDSFYDLAELLVEPSTRSKPDLVALIGQMALAAPESLVACGVEEFDPESDDESY